MATVPEKSSSPTGTMPPQTGFINPLTGLFGKAIDTALDVWTIHEQSKANQAVPGSISPTGQVSPETLASQKAALNPPAQMDMKYLLIYGGIAAAVVLVGVIAFNSSKR